MDIIGVICEFNPFHKGHKFLAENIKERFGGCITVGIMSGNFVQRGDCAVISKYDRARQALENGFDLIIELPTVYAASSAEVFAKAGARLSNALGCNILAFGAESPLPRLEKIAELKEDISYNETIQNELKLGKSYPAAAEQAVKMLMNDETSDKEFLNGPNDILAVEYIRAIKNYPIVPYAIKRRAVAHDSSVACDGYLSASAIRKMLLENSGDPYKYMPEGSNKEAFENPASINNLENAILYKLRTMTADNFAALPDVSEGLENRFISAARSYNSVAEILTAVKTKRYTMARLRRIIIYALLGITKEMQRTPVPYIRVLGFNDRGAGILTRAKNSAALPIITKVSTGIKQLDKTDRTILEKDLLASNIWALAQKNPQPCGADFYREIIKAECLGTQFVQTARS